MKDWLTVIILLLIVAIVLDGVRRMRLSRRENIRLSKNAQKADLETAPPVGNSEFPSGGARVVSYRDEEDAVNLNESVRQTFETGRSVGRGSQRIPEQVSLNLEQSVPMLMDSVDDTDNDHASEDVSDEQSEVPSSPAHEYAQDADNVHEDGQQHDEVMDSQDPQIGSLEDLDDTQSHERLEPNVDEERVSDDVLSADLDRASSPNDTPQAGPISRSYDESETPLDDTEYHEPDEVLIMNVMAKPGCRFNGADLLATLMEAGLKFGDMNIFHRHHNNDGDAPIIYSLANMVVPGTFNFATMSDFETPGISLFLSLPVVGESLAAYNDLAQTARYIADQLEGELKDENRSVMTSQTIEHGRQRVMEYERKKKLTRA